MAWKIRRPEVVGCKTENQFNHPKRKRCKCVFAHTEITKVYLHRTPLRARQCLLIVSRPFFLACHSQRPGASQWHLRGLKEAGHPTLK